MSMMSDQNSECFGPITWPHTKLSFLVSKRFTPFYHICKKLYFAHAAGDADLPLSNQVTNKLSFRY